MIYIGLKRGTGIYSQLIRIWTRSNYSHAMVINDDGDGKCTVYEATAKSGTIMRHATREQLIREGVEIYHANRFFSFSSAYHNAEIMLSSQVGTSYDWTAIFYSRVFNIDRQESAKWFCFELVAWAFGMEKSWRWTGRTFQDKLDNVI